MEIIKPRYALIPKVLSFLSPWRERLLRQWICNVLCQNIWSGKCPQQINIIFQILYRKLYFHHDGIFIHYFPLTPTLRRDKSPTYLPLHRIVYLLSPRSSEILDQTQPGSLSLPLSLSLSLSLSLLLFGTIIISVGHVRGIHQCWILRRYWMTYYDNLILCLSFLVLTAHFLVQMTTQENCCRIQPVGNCFPALWLAVLLMELDDTLSI